MTRISMVWGCALLAAATLFADGVNRAGAWVGQWKGEMDGQPSITLTLGNDGGAVGGSVVFNVIMRNGGGQAYVGGSDSHVLLNARMSGDTLQFEVIRHSDSKQLHMTVKFEGDEKARFQCLDCGEPEPVVELVKVR